MDLLQKLGVNKKQPLDFFRNLFYFMREVHYYPLSEEYEVVPVYRDGKVVKYTVKKLAMSMDIFNKLMEKMSEHYENEAREIKKMRRK